MAHFAQLDENNIVLQIIVVNNEELLDENGNEIEQKGIDFCHSLLGGNWKQTSYNRKIRGKFAGIGMFYDQDRDVFRYLNAPEGNPSFVLNNNGDWVPPIPYPSDSVINNEEPQKTKIYTWNEETLSWTILPYVDPLEMAEEMTTWQ
jgi:hypothetical protein